MSRTSSRRGRPASGRTFLVLGLCACALILHFLTDNVHHFSMMGIVSQMVEQTHLESSGEEGQEGDFILADFGPPHVDAFLTARRLIDISLLPSLSVSPLLPPPKIA